MSKAWWDLNEKANSLTDVADAWGEVSGALSTTADEFGKSSRRALGDWEGDSADSFGTQYKKVLADLDAMVATTKAAAGTLHAAAGSVRRAQSTLDDAWATVMGIPHKPGPYGTLIFDVADEAEREKVAAANRTASETRTHLDDQLAGYERQLRSYTTNFGGCASRWQAYVERDMSFVAGVPAEGLGVGLVFVDGRAILSGGAGDNKISVEIDPKTGDQLVTVDGVKYRIPAGIPLTIRGGGGDDTIDLPSDSTIGFTVIGGRGLDRIKGGGGADRIFAMSGDDEVRGGAGSDYISGGAGQDYIDGQDGNDRLFGGAGRDTLYGLGGSDKLSGGSGQDYLEGGEGEDVLDGGLGNDVLSGGRGDDQIFGGGGDDVSYGGLGSDTVIGGSGKDTSHDDAPSSGTNNEVNVRIEIPEDTSMISIEGSPEFVARVKADLDMLRSSPAGKDLLAHLQESHDNSGFLGMFKNSLTIREFVPEYPGHQNSTASPSWSGQYSISYLPTIDDFRGAPPVVVLQHELAHVDDYAHGTFRSELYKGDDHRDHGFRAGERVAVGVPIDHDDNPATPEIIDPKHPIERTENGLRAEMGLPKRAAYGG